MKNAPVLERKLDLQSSSSNKNNEMKNAPVLERKLDLQSSSSNKNTQKDAVTTPFQRSDVVTTSIQRRSNVLWQSD